MDDIDFNIDNYDIDELIQLLNFDKVPTNEDMIVHRIDVLKRKYKSKPKYIKFFSEIGKKLILNFEHFNKETWEEQYEQDDSLSAKVLTQQYLDEKDDFKNLMLDPNRNIIGIKKLPNDQRYSTKSNTQGVRNPITINQIRRIVNFDSQYREILNPISTTCADINGNYTVEPNNIDQINHVNPEIRLFQPTNYTVNLNQPLSNVVDISLESVEIPNTWYVFSSDYGTNALEFVYTNSGNIVKNKVKIEDGNYQPVELVTEINTLCQMNNIPILFEYKVINGKISVSNQDKAIEWTINFYIEDSESSGCAAQKTLNEEGSNTPSPGNKIGYNLGWLLGFRVKTLVLNPSEKKVASSILDTFGPKYFLLTLDDFNNNKPNKDLISLVDSSSKNFKLPKYYNPQTMDSRYNKDTYYPGKTANDGEDWKCKDIAGPPAERGCAENELNIDLASNLTKKQQYTVEQLTLANTSNSTVTLDDNTTLSTVVNRYRSPNSSDLLARIPININRQQYNTSIVFRNRNPEYTKRVYFGPVKLRKFKIRLLNDKGFEVNLNDQDWSFSIYVTQLYQF